MPSLVDPIVIVEAVLWTVILGSLAVWCVLLDRSARHLSWLNWLDVERPPRPLWAVAAALGWTLLSVVDRAVADWEGRRAEPTIELLGFALVLSMIVLAIVAALLFGSGRFGIRDAGVNLGRLYDSITLGTAALLAAVLPTGLAILATVSVRSQESQHAFLRLLGQTPDPWVVAILAFTAVVVAPLSEELVFRVTLQGWLASWCGSHVAVPVISLLFAAIHGWRDGLALIPLALVLGYVYDRRNDYVAVVVTHGLFNAMNLMLMLLSKPPDAV